MNSGQANGLELPEGLVLLLSCVPVFDFIAKLFDYFISFGSLVNNVKPEELELSSFACFDQAMIYVD